MEIFYGTIFFCSLLQMFFDNGSLANLLYFMSTFFSDREILYTLYRLHDKFNYGSFYRARTTKADVCGYVHVLAISRYLLQILLLVLTGYS
jgi:hypothetical protein